ncbi:MAG: cysteine desulfurase family protein [Tissierellia bacterium]|nr:cysteine desulfurase family protein [Tissierellia bacterium]
MIYLDNAATTRMYDEVIDAEKDIEKNYFANPAAIHSFGMESENLLKETRKKIAKYLGCDKDEIFFTKGATESNNIAIKSFESKDNEAITSNLEHASIYNTYRNSNYSKVHYIKNDDNGIFDLDDLISKINDRTKIVSLIEVNNEIATINDIKSIAKKIKDINKDIIVHVDGTQAFGKIRRNVKDSLIDIYTFSSHKIHGPKGCGGMYINNDILKFIKPVLEGGNQEKVSSGTVNVPAIYAMGIALNLILEKSDYEKIGEIKNYFIDRLEEIDGIKIIAKDANTSNYILNCCFSNIKAEVLLHFLEQEEIYVSSGSACSHGKSSRILDNINVSDKFKDGSIRFSFNEFITKSDIDKTMDVLKESIKTIREVYR